MAKRTEYKTTSITLPMSLYKQVKAYAKKGGGRSFGSVVREAVEKEISTKKLG